MWVIIVKEDTRSFDENGKAIPGTGDLRPCEHCGAMHEVHVTIEHSVTSERKTVGATCAKKLAGDPHKLLARHATDLIVAPCIDKWNRKGWVRIGPYGNIINAAPDLETIICEARVYRRVIVQDTTVNLADA